MSLDWKTLHSLIGVEGAGESSAVFSGVASLKDATSGEISFLGNSKYEPHLAATKASVVLVPPGDFKAPTDCHLITVTDPSDSFSAIIDFFQRDSRPFEPGVSGSAHVGEGVVLNREKVEIGPGTVIEDGAMIGDGTIIEAGCLIGKGVMIGQDCHLHLGVKVREGCRLGNRVILQPGCVIGSDGYGFQQVDGRHQKVPQVGIVEIEDDVEIGANSCVDRARFGRTLIGEGTKIDNLVQIAHNVRLGKHCLVIAQSGIAGSTTLGDYVTLAAQSGVAGHLEIADQVVIGGKSGVAKNLPEPGIYIGVPARPIAADHRKRAEIARLPKMRKELQMIKKMLEEMSGE